MNSGKPDDRFVVADQPANRRRVPVSEPRPAAAHPLAQQRARKALSRGRLGEPLAGALLAGPATGPAPLPGLAVAGFVGAAGLLPFAALSPGWGARAALGAGAVVLAAAGWWRAHRARRAWHARQGLAPTPTAVVDVQWLEQLDGLLDTVAAELPDEAMAPLLSLKATLLRALRLLSQVGPDQRFTVEDRLYIVECVRRYLPDTVSAYLRVPAVGREQALDDGRTATEVFIAQIGLLQQALAQREARGAVTAAEGLLQQQRFLEAKARAKR